MHPFNEFSEKCFEMQRYAQDAKNCLQMDSRNEEAIQLAASWPEFAARCNPKNSGAGGFRKMAIEMLGNLCIEGERIVPACGAL